ncbi:MAG: hypothetical protein IJS12_05050 [Lachnospiraceae bacterium]|nr:hypothetical protein [Lachnospiraceae bacterium]
MTKEGRPNNPLYSAFAYDDAFRTMETECDDILIPFYIFNYKMELDDIDADADRIAALADLYKGIINRLDAEQESGRLSSKSHGVIIRLTHKVIYKIMEKYNNAREKVGDVMGGEVLDLPEIRAYNEGKAEGMAKGKAEGMAKGKAEGQAERDALEAENERLKQEIERLRAASV